MMRKGLSMLLCAALAAGLLAVSPAARTSAAANDVQVVDKFGRNLASYGVDLVDWQGYIANPYVKLTVKAPSSASFPVTVTVKAQGSSRLMMDLPSTLSATGATKTLTFANSSQSQDFKLEIAPDRVGGNGEIENYTLSFVVAENNGTTHTQSMPIRVLDQDDNAAPTLPLVFDYRFDTVNHYFDNAAYRAAAEQAIKDWFYFFDEQPFDSVPAGAEPSFVPNDNFAGNTTVTNNAAYTGEWIFLRGLNGPYSTGWASNNGQYHKRGGVQVPGQIHRSLGMALDFYDNATVFTSLDDNDWYKTDLNQVTDVYGLVMHEIGHGIAYSDVWNGMATYHDNGGVDPEVVAYQGHQVALDSSYHIPGDEASWDRISGQSAGWTSYFPTRRWMLTKLSLLIAENAGWKLNKNLTPFLAPSIVTPSLPAGTAGAAYSQKLTAKGGVPFYDWTITSGSLPSGLTLDRFTGTISGTIAGSAAASSTFTVQLRDYDDQSSPVTKTFTIPVSGGTGGGSVKYEAESATINDAYVYTSSAASGGSYVGGIDNAGSYVSFAANAPSAGTYAMTVRYANGTGANATHNLTVNGGAAQTVTYPATAGWGQFGSVTANVTLAAGANTIRLSKGTTGYAELDYIQLDPAATPTPTNIAGQATASTSFVSSWESLAGLNDGYSPTGSNDRGHPVYGNWDNPGTTQWVQYDFAQAKTLSKAEVYWFDDDQGIDLPASCSFQYWNGSAWVNVGSPSGLGVLGNQFNVTTFAPVTTTKIRLNVTAKAGYSSGIEQWRVYGY